MTKRKPPAPERFNSGEFAIIKIRAAHALVGEFQAIGTVHKGLLFGLARVQTVDERRFAEEKIELINGNKHLLEGVVGVNGEVGGND